MLTIFTSSTFDNAKGRSDLAWMSSSRMVRRLPFLKEEEDETAVVGATASCLERRRKE